MAKNPVAAPASGTAETVLAFAKAVGAERMTDVTAFVNELFRLGKAVGWDAFRIAVQSALETNNWRAAQWTQRLNPGAIGVTDGGDQGLGWKTGEDAARAMLVHTAAYLGTLPDALKPYVSLDPRYDIVRQAGHAGKVVYFSDYGNGRWATDPQYARNLETREAWVRQYESASGGGAADTTITLPFKLNQWLIPVGQTNQRPGIKQTPKWVVQHETANYNVGANAKMHAQWLQSGAPGVSDRQVSVHFFVDDAEAWQLLPIDEVSWNAGCGNCEGNYGGVSIELCVNKDGDFEKARRNAAILSAWLLQRLGKGIDAYSSHNYWSGKNCPALLLGRGLWQNQREMVASYLKGTTPAVYAAPIPVVANGVEWDGTDNVVVNGVTFMAERRRVSFVGTGVVRQWAATDAERTQAPISAGGQADVLGWVEGEKVDGENRWWVLANWGRVHASATREKPTPPTPVTPDVPITPDNPVLPDVPSGPKIVNGRRVYFVGADGKGRAVHATKDGVCVREWVDPASGVRRTLAKGEAVVARYWLIGPQVGDEPVWWITDDLYAVNASDTVERPV